MSAHVEHHYPLVLVPHDKAMTAEAYLDLSSATATPFPDEGYAQAVRSYSVALLTSEQSGGDRYTELRAATRAELRGTQAGKSLEYTDRWHHLGMAAVRGIEDSGTARAVSAVAHARSLALRSLMDQQDDPHVQTQKQRAFHTSDMRTDALHRSGLGSHHPLISHSIQIEAIDTAMRADGGTWRASRLAIAGIYKALRIGRHGGMDFRIRMQTRAQGITRNASALSLAVTRPFSNRSPRVQQWRESRAYQLLIND